MSARLEVGQAAGGRRSTLGVRTRRPAGAGRWPGRLLLLLLCLGGGVGGCRPPEQRQATARRELALQQLGAVISLEEPQARVLVVGNPFAARAGADDAIRQAEAASLRGLQRGLGPGAKYLGVGLPALRPEAERDPSAVSLPPGATTPLSFFTTAGAWDRLREAYPESTVWVSLIGFPADLAETRAWTDPAGPRWALYLPDLRMVGSRAAIRTAFESRRLLALVILRPGAPAEAEPMAADPRQEFERRYLLATRETFEALADRWPQLFP